MSLSEANRGAWAPRQAGNLLPEELKKDFPLLQSCVLLIGVIFLVATLVADILYSILNPRLRLGAAE